ncbi:MAG: hypothetical protein HDS95_04045 [Bacteroidales bacterium]|nr:hypothetical protein [Bacteroidales bacterium]
MKKKLLYSLLFGMFASPSVFGADYGLPAGIQQGNILHCFNWPAKDVKAALPQIAAAGFGSVQLSPLQRPDAKVGNTWADLYRPYDLAFKSSSFCSEQDLKDLCAAAKEYGIKIIVDVVANHVDKTAGYHDTWWDSGGRVRWDGGINYGNRYSITHGQLGDYGDVNSELSEVAAKGKAYVTALKNMGVSGIRWDAAKHIGLPSEGCQFWKEVTSVPGVWHYGEILDSPGPDAGIIKEYGTYMAVTDNEYSNYAAKSNGGIPGGYGGSWAVNYGLGAKVVYWGESHDTYSNEEWSQNVDQSVIDRAYAAYACRNEATALYLSRPSGRTFNSIKVGKGSTAFTAKHIAEVNKFRNLMVGKADYCEAGSNTFCVTRQGGGAVIVMKGSGNVTVKNGGGYCPAGTYTDRVSGGTFTVTASEIKGNVGSSGIAVLIKDGVAPDPNPTPDPDPNPTPNPTDGDMWILGNIDGHQWTTNSGATMTLSNGKYVANGVKLTAATGETKCFFNITDALGADWDELNMVANRYGAVAEGASITLGTPASVVKYANGVDASGCLSWTIAAGTYDFTFDPSAMTLTVVNAGDNPNPNPDPNPTPNPDPNPGILTITGDYNLCYNGNLQKVYYWGGVSKPEWPGENMTTVKGSDGNSYKVFKVPEGTTNVIFTTQGDPDKTMDLDYTAGFVMDNNGATFIPVRFDNGDNPPVTTKPVVTASPASGTVFTDNAIYVTLTVTPAATIHYSLNGTATASSAVYSGPITISETATLSTYAVTADGVSNTQSFSYTKKNNDDPNPPTPPAPAGKNLITDYYKVNPFGRSGSNRSVTMNFTGQKSNTALSNWGDDDLIAQGVARDVCQAFKGVHERPIVDSYALYAAYDHENLYLGVQYVYTVWDIGGEGKQPGESKPYNMDGKLCLAFDLDPAKSAKGLTNANTSIWQDGIYTTFDNGADAWWYGSTKPGAGTPGFFVPNASGICDYSDPNSCKTSTVKYGYADGLLPSINAVYGQDDFSYDPELLKGNTGFIDLRSQIDDSAHTFYEYTIPLSLLGVTEDYIKNTGIGVMVVDFYGSSAHSSLPYDPCFYDNVFESYSQDPSSSAEKEDKNEVTYGMARIGKMSNTSVVELPCVDEAVADAEPIYYTLQGVKVLNPSNGVYIVVRGNKVTKEYVR